MTPLCELSRRYGTDKGGVMFPTPNHRANLFHDYTPIYWEHMKDWASEAWSLLEIGVAEGRSARMWAEFLPNAQIAGFDIDPKSLLIIREIASTRISAIRVTRSPSSML